MEKILDIKQLSLGFHQFSGRTHVLNNVSINVERGQQVGLVGETGCGKSLTMQTTIGAVKSPPAWIECKRLSFKDYDLLKMKKKDIKAMRGGSLSMVFQDPISSLNPVFTIREQLKDVILSNRGRNGEGRVKKRNLEKKMCDLLTELNLSDPDRILNSYPIQLSGGMRQRVLIAMAIVNNPELLIADEIGTALDVTVQSQVIRMVSDLVRRHGMASVVISHNLGVINTMCETIYVMYAGQVVEKAESQELFRRPLHPYTQALIASLPTLVGKGLSKGIPGRIPDYHNPPTGCRFHPRCELSETACKEVPSSQKVNEHVYRCIHGPEKLDRFREEVTNE